MSPSFDHKLTNYAELLVQKGVNVGPGQRLHVTCPVEAADLARQVTDAAYRAGAKLVEIHWTDDAVHRSRFLYAAPETFDEIPTARADSLIKGVARGDALLAIHATDPDLLKGQDPELVAKVQRMTMEYMEPYSEAVSASRINWCVAAAALDAWAARVFPDEPEGTRVARLWDAIFAATRMDAPDPIAAWDAHAAELARRRAYLNERQFDALRYTGPGTDLTLGMPKNHIWKGGADRTADGQEFIANIPTEEVFTLPHRGRAEGTVRSTMPLSYAGTLIDGISLTFSDGKVVKMEARQGEEALRRLLETDEGASRLGEVALVPHGSPISASGVLFYNTLFDENAACHLAVGRAYSMCLEGGTGMSGEELEASGANRSVAHVDFMIGSGDLDIDGLNADGTSVPLMRSGEWADRVGADAGRSG